MDRKIQAFEYLIFRLIKWHNEATSKQDNDISVLKALKLLFFVSAVNTHKESKNTLLDDVFNNFVAMPYGHVESDVYSDIRNGRLTNIIINNKNSAYHPDFNVDLIPPDIRHRIDEQVESLKKINFLLITLPSFDLVDLSHMYYSWQINIKRARSLGMQSAPISNEEIKSEMKIFQL